MLDEGGQNQWLATDMKYQREARLSAKHRAVSRGIETKSTQRKKVSARWRSQLDMKYQREARLSAK